jgi:putative transposase
VRPVLERVARFADLLETDPDGPAFMVLRCSELVGRPLGSEAFTRRGEALLGRTLAPGKRGPKPKTPSAAAQKRIYARVTVIDPS